MSHGIETPLSDINLLLSDMQKLAKLYLKLAKDRNLDIMIFETERMSKRQEYLFKKGYSKLKSGSMHQYCIAFDAVFRNKDGSPSWDAKHPWEKSGQIGRDIGLYWGGDFKGGWDKPHFQLVPAQPRPQGKIRKGDHPTSLPPVLKQGSWGDHVRILQILINTKYDKYLVVDGSYGKKSHMAVEYVQRKNKLTVDGICYGGVWQALI